MGAWLCFVCPTLAAVGVVRVLLLLLLEARLRCLQPLRGAPTPPPLFALPSLSGRPLCQQGALCAAHPGPPLKPGGSLLIADNDGTSRLRRARTALPCRQRRHRGRRQRSRSQHVLVSCAQSVSRWCMAQVSPTCTAALPSPALSRKAAILLSGAVVLASDTRPRPPRACVVTHYAPKTAVVILQAHVELWVTLYSTQQCLRGASANAPRRGSSVCAEEVAAAS